MIKEKELLDLENSFIVLEKLPIANYLVLPINSNLDKFEKKIKKLKFPLWIKLNTAEHKTKLGAVKKCFDFEELKKIYTKLKKKFPGKKFIIQEDVSGIEIIAGIKQDRTFGKVLLVGSGGSFVELIKDIQFRVCPVNKEEIFQALQELKSYRLMKEKNFCIRKLISLIEKFSKLEVKEADLNPIIINEKKAVIVDARIEI